MGRIPGRFLILSFFSLGGDPLRIHRGASQSVSFEIGQDWRKQTTPEEERFFVLLATMGFNLQPERGDSSPEKHHSFTLYHLPPGRSATKRDMLFHRLYGGKANPRGHLSHSDQESGVPRLGRIIFVRAHHPSSNPAPQR